VGDGGILLNLGTGDCFELDAVGAFIWERRREGVDERALCAAVTDAFEVGAERAAADTRAFLRMLREAGFSTPADRATIHAPAPLPKKLACPAFDVAKSGLA
jgi:hypothetical protein